MNAFLRREGDVWAIQLDGRTARVRDSKGMQHLAVLLARPGIEVHSLELAGAPASVTSTDSAPLLDDRARAAYRQRLADLASDLDEADEFNDRERSARIQAEIDALVDQLTSAAGLGGRDRGTVTDAERARVAVRRAMKAALDRIAQAHPALGAHLTATVRTGIFCSYVPDPASPVQWVIGDAPETDAPVAAPQRPIVVGRDVEQAALARAWRSGGVALITGEPGIGKTTLVSDLAATVTADGALAISGRCDDHLGVPYQPIVEALRALVTVDGAATVCADAAISTGALARLVPELGVAAPAPDAPDTERLLLFDGVARVIGAAATRRPLLLSIDDLHWAAVPTLGLLLHLARQIAGSPALIALSYRSTEIGDDLAAFLGDLARVTAPERIALSGLDADAVVELGATADVAKRLTEHTGGNPFFVRALLDEGTDELPASVRDVMTARLRRLPDDARRVASLVAVAGDRAPLSMVAHELDAVDALLEAGILVDEGAALAFPHALVRRAITDGLSGPRRASLHLEVGRALEAAGASSANLAHHFAAAAAVGVADDAVRYGVAAADDALAAFAWEEASDHARRALGVAPDGGAGTAALLLRLGAALQASGDPDGARAALSDAADIAASAGDTSLLVDIVLERATRGGLLGAFDPDVLADLERVRDQLVTDDPRRPRVLARLAIELHGAGRLDEACATASDAVDAARATDDPATLAIALRSQCFTLEAFEARTMRGPLAIEFAAAAAATDDIELRIGAAGAQIAAALDGGDVEALDRHIAELSAMADVVRIARYQWYALQYRAMRAHLAGDLETAQALSDECFGLGDAAAIPNAGPVWGAQVIAVRHDQGRAGELADLGRTFAQSYPLKVTWAMVALAYAAAGRADGALEALSELSGLADLQRDAVWLGTVAITAEVAMRIGDLALAADADALLTPFAGLNVGISLGAIAIGPVDRFRSFAARTIGDHNRARAHLLDAIALDQRMHAQRWLERDTADLATLTGAALTT